MDLNNTIINLAYPYQYSLSEILCQLESHLGKEAVYDDSDEGSFYTIEFNELTESFYRNISNGILEKSYTQPTYNMIIPENNFVPCTKCQKSLSKKDSDHYISKNTL